MIYGLSGKRRRESSIKIERRLLRRKLLKSLNRCNNEHRNCASMLLGTTTSRGLQ